MTTVMVSGCFDIIHGGHVEFLRQAAALGDELIVCVAGDDVVLQHKGRMPTLPASHRQWVLHNLSMVTDTHVTQPWDMGLDFAPLFHELQPDVLAVTIDDAYAAEKQALCEAAGINYVQLPKEPYLLEFRPPISTTSIRTRIAGTDRVPLRVDFGGGWLDVPKHARDGAYIVNCAIQPLVTREDWGNYRAQSGLGGSAAWAMLNGRDAFACEAGLGVGWQDPAVITETGLCTWASGPMPVLVRRCSGEILRGKMAIWWTGKDHDIKEIAELERDYELIRQAGAQAGEAHAMCFIRQGYEGCLKDINGVEAGAWIIRALMGAMNVSIKAQLAEGMPGLPSVGHASARKYLGAGWGGYALYLFASTKERNLFVVNDDNAQAIEPYCKWSDA